MSIRPLRERVSSRPKTTTAFLVLCVLGLLVARDPGRIGLGHRVPLHDAVPDGGSSFVVHLDDAEASSVKSARNLRLTECVHVPPTKRLERFLGWSYVFQYFDDAWPKRFPDATIESCWRIGTGNRPLQRVRSRGEGAFFAEGELLYFSTSDNSDPRFNGRDYRLDVAIAPPRALTGSLAALALISAIALSIPVSAAAVRWYARLYRSSRVFQNTAPGLLISVLVLGLIYGMAEVYLRLTVPFLATTWPSHFDPRVGFLFNPDTTVKYSDGSEYWTETRVNSLGFLDREPRIPKPDGTFRIVVIGDSFVEAVQVEIPQKFPVLLEEILNRTAPPGPPIDTVAMGYSGTGQVNQLAFYDAFGARLRPDLVILLFEFNDFANNSSLLEAVRNGWSPVHPPRLFLRRRSDGAFERFGLEPDWEQNVLPVTHDQSYEQSIASRTEYLRSLPESRDALGDWRPSQDLDIDNMFYAADMPPVFNDALSATSEAFRQFADYAKRDGFSLLVVATPHESPSSVQNRQVTPLLARARLREIVATHDIPLFDLSPGFKKRGEPGDATFKRDSHWNARGHQWVAEEIADYLLAHPALIRR